VICRDRIEEAIIRAYLRLAWEPNRENGLRTIIVTQFGCLEIRMSERPLHEVPPLIAPFRIEIYSYESGIIIGSGEYFEFDEDELSAAVDLIYLAQVNQPALH